MERARQGREGMISAYSRGKVESFRLIPVMGAGGRKDQAQLEAWEGES